MDDLDNILEQPIETGYGESYDDNDKENLSLKEGDDILGLEKEIQVKTRRKLVTLNDQKLLSKSGLQYLYDHRNKMKYLKHNKSDYNPKDFTSHYTYKNMSTILEFYQLWAHKLFPKLRFKDAILLANRKTSGDSRNVRFFRERLIEQEIQTLFPDETIDVASEHDDIDVDYENNDIELDVQVPQGNSMFVDDDDLYTVSSVVRPVLSAVEPTVLPPLSTEPPTLQEDEDPFSDDEIFNTSHRKLAIIQDDEIPDMEEFTNEEDRFQEQLELMDEMGL